ncbi:MAG: IreB family regulatory phosphoprotein [bacterium]|nr:IreB family regulatory phosphoprotein [bacterium]
MEISETHAYSIESFEEQIVKDVIKDVYEALEERGYNPINQLVGYIMSGDPGYISSHKEARSKITKLERNKILEVLLREYIKNI